MKNKIKQTTLLVLSCASLVATIGYSSWIVQSHQEYALKNLDKTSKPVAYIVGNDKVKYTSIEKALDVAKSGDIVCVIPPSKPNYNDSTNKVLPDQITYKISRNCEIKTGVTLFVPTDKASEKEVTDASSLKTYIENMKKSQRDQGTSGYDSFAENSSNKFLRITLEIESGKTLTNNGTLLISGYLSGGTNNGGSIGQTSHSYSRILLKGNAKITQASDSAITYCFGFIDETSDNSSSFLVEKGKLYVPLVVNDYRGFVYSYSMTGGAIDKQRCSPFNVLQVRNIGCRTKISYSASVYALINVYVKYDSLEVNETVLITKNLIGSTSDFIIQQTEKGGYVSSKYDKRTDVLSLNFYGGFNLSYLELTLEVKGQKVPLSTQNAYFPLSYKMHVGLYALSSQSECTYDVSKQRIKVLTGSKLSVGKNVLLKGNELIAYSSFLDGSNGNGQGIKDSGRNSYPVKEGAIVEILNGGKLDFSSLAGTIFCEDSSNVIKQNDTITSKEPWNYGTNTAIVPNPPWVTKDYLEIREKLTLVPLSYEDKKKIFAGLNVFTSTKEYCPSYNVIINDEAIVENVSAYQKVIFLDEITNYKIEFVSNLFKVFCGNKAYEKNSLVPYSNSTNTIAATNSSVSISNNNQNVNEFDVQNVTISGPSHSVDVGTVLQLTGTINDIDKSYNKSYKWSSLNPAIATVDNEGLVTGVSAGETTISLTCDGKTGTYDVKVVQPVAAVEKVASVTIKAPKGQASGADFKDGDYKFTATILSESGKVLGLDDITSINWVIVPEHADRGYIGDKTNHEKSGSLEVKITLNGGLAASEFKGATPDKVTLTCTVVGKAKGNTVTQVFTIMNNNGCLLPSALVLMANGSYKQAGLIRTGDMVMSFNHETGTIEPNVVIGNDDISKPAQVYDVVHLEFSNGMSTDFIDEHGYFDITLNKYVYLHSDDAEEYIGHEFVSVNGNLGINTVKLVSVSVVKTFTTLCSPATANSLNIIADGMLSIAGGLTGLFNIFEYDPKTLAFDKEKMQSDIRKYGLLTYMDFERFFPKEIYDLLPCKYLGVSIGKGLITWEIFESYVNKWKDQLMENLK